MADQGVRPGANQFVIFVQAGSHAKLPAQVLNGGPRQHGCHPRENQGCGHPSSAGPGFRGEGGMRMP
jgi:hypothetical protein